MLFSLVRMMAAMDVVTIATSACMWLELVRVLLLAGSGCATRVGHSWWKTCPVGHLQVLLIAGHRIVNWHRYLCRRAIKGD